MDEENFSSSVKDTIESAPSSKVLVPNSLLYLKQIKEDKAWKDISFIVRYVIATSVLLTVIVFVVCNIIQLPVFIFGALSNSKEWDMLDALRLIDKFFIAYIVFMVAEMLIELAVSDAQILKDRDSSKILAKIDDSLVSMVLITCAITFLTIILSESTKLDVFLSGLGIGAFISALTYWKNSHK